MFLLKQIAKNVSHELNLDFVSSKFYLWTKLLSINY